MLEGLNTIWHFSYLLCNTTAKLNSSDNKRNLIHLATGDLQDFGKETNFKFCSSSKHLI